MNKKKVFAIVGIFLLLLTSLRMIWFYYYSTSDYPNAKEGVLDLRGIELLDDMALTLDGEWTFYKGQLINPKSTDEQLSSLVQTGIAVPGDWKEELSNEDDSPFGYGTYHLRILLNESEKEQYRFYFNDIRTDAVVFVNGEKVAEMGHLDVEKNKVTSYFHPFEVLVESDQGEMDLMIHVSNYKAMKRAGIVKSIQFGTDVAVKKAQMMSFFMQFMTVVILLLHGIYTLIIFLVFVRKKEVLFLVFAFLFAMISILVDDDKILLYFYPTISFGWWVKLINLSYASSVFFVLLFFKSLWEEYGVKRTLLPHAFKALIIVYSLLIVCTFMDYQRLVSYLLMGVLLFIPIVIPPVLFKMVSTGRSGSVYLLLATVSLASSAVWGIVEARYIDELPYYPFDMIIAVIFFAVFWFKHFFQAREESKELTEKLQRADKRKDDFLANTSHELRNPLHGIMNITQTIYESEKNLTDENKENLQVLMTVSRRMSMVLNDLLDIEKLKEKGIHLKKEKVNLSAVVSGVFDMLHFMKEGKSIRLINKVSNASFLVEADENRLFQILFNLIHNAVKYSDEGDIIVSAETKKGWAMIQIQDHGIGMDSETIKSIFQPYEQADSSMTAIAGGIGLGLSICKELVELHGGTLSIESFEGKGSTFTFTLPTVSNVVQESAATIILETNKVDMKTASSLNQGLPRLLLVDDDPLNLAIIERVLLAEKYEIVTCTSGKDALRLLEKGSWDLVISDVMMPNMSGYELTKKIRERFAISELPILLLTARSQMEDKQAGFYAGASDYVTKPVEKLELTMRVRSLTNLKKSIHERVRMEAAWLQAQIQPHFLFNTLNTIVALSEIDPPKMIKLLDHFGDYLHASFATKNLDQVVFLERELDLVRSYVYIEQQRFGERLRVKWEIDEMPSIQVPPLSIQTLIENAINHGVLQRPEGGTVSIQIKEFEESVEIKIVDNGVGIPKERLNKLLTNQGQGHKGIGLLNTDKRLKQLYGHGLDINSAEFGTTVRFIVPKEQ